MSGKLTKEIAESLNDAWLNIDKKNSEIINPFDILKTDDPEEFHMKLAWIFMNPDFFSFTCKHILNIEILPIQALILKEMWIRKFPMLVATRGFGKTWLLSVYSMLRALLIPNRKVVVVGSAFRQSKYLYDYMENIVIAGFAAVSASPAENVKAVAKQKMAESLGVDIQGEITPEGLKSKSNQIIISGTAYYDFNHFAEYWKRWRAIIQSKGDLHKLQTDVFNNEEPPASFDWRDYSIIRVPVELSPKGFMDEGQIARSKATVHSGIFLMEFGAVFAKDSQGFFKRSLIESCVGTDIKPIDLPSGQVYFDAATSGVPGRQYVMGVDPASEVDNFSIVILEIHEDHRRIKYCWTTTRSEHVEKVQRGLVSDNNFYSYCARKIRDLMSVFNISHIAIDSQGGGVSVSEALHDTTQLRRGEIPIWPIIEEDKEKPSDDESGLHILEMCNFAKYDWYSEANHGLRKDLEDRVLIFPRYDAITIGLSIEDDKKANRLYDTLEDCVLEIEALKDEMSLIEITQTQTSGRDRWDTPEVKIGVGKKKRMRKDRYSALLMANMASRTLSFRKTPIEYNSHGGFADSIKSESKGKPYLGPAWFTEAMDGVY